MAHPSQSKLRIFAAGIVVLAAAMAVMTSGCSGDEGVASVECESTRQYFAKNVWQVVGSQCFACHNAQGLAKDTSYVLKGPSEPGFLDHNLKVISEVASFEQDGQSLWLLKPTHSLPHEGGKVITKGSDAYKAMLGLVVRLKNPDQCEPTNESSFAGVEIASAQLTLRKAALILASRMPTAEEIQRVDEGGVPALEAILDEMMTEPAFLDFVRNAYGDMLQTDFYLNNDVVGLLDEVYANPFWFEGDEGKVAMAQYKISDNEVGRFTQQAIAREPLEIIAHVVKHDRPFTEILTADYTVMSPLSARSYGVFDQLTFENGADAFEYVEGRYPKYTNSQGQEVDFPHAGVLTTPAFLARWPTTATNRNRARSRVFMLFFLGLDILKTADQPVNQSSVTTLNPQRDDPNCVVCHANVDPIAGVFQAFHRFGDDDAQTVAFQTDPQWYQEMWPPGFNGYDLPLDQAAYGLPWLAYQASQDDRFVLGAVYMAYRGLTGREPLIAPKDFEDPEYDGQFESFLKQANVFHDIAIKMKNANYNFKVAVKELVLSPYFRGINAVKLDSKKLAALGEVGLGRLLTPKQLHAKLVSVLGLSWGGNDDPYLTNPPRDISDSGAFELFYGGVNFTDVSVRITEPNGVMASVAERMAIQMACEAAPRDFVRAPADRKLFPIIEIEGQSYDPLKLVPESGGFAVTQAEQGIREVVRHLHAHLLGEELPIDHEEIDRTYNLFLETWREGTAGMQGDNATISQELPFACAITQDEFGEDLPEEEQLYMDDQYTIRSWMAVLTYLLSDYKFLYE